MSPPPNSRVEAMHFVGDFVESLKGAFIVGPDSGSGTDDMDLIRERTDYVVGYSTRFGGLGDPAPSTARTVMNSMAIALETVTGSNELRNRHVGVMGVGNVGRYLVKYLVDAGARVTVTDIDQARLAAVRVASAVESVPVGEFLAQPFDVLSPCGSGQVIGEESARSLNCMIVAGAANNPLTSASVSSILHQRGVFYVPDFIANCGGVIRIAVEYRRGDEADVDAALKEAGRRAREILWSAQERHEDPLVVATQYAEECIARGETHV